MRTRMQSHWAMALGVGMAAAITASAQTPTPQGQPAASDRGRGSVTATGCLERAVATAAPGDQAGAPSAPGAASKPEEAFVLRNAQMSGASTPGTPGGAAGAAAAHGPSHGPKARSIRLVAGAGVNFADHIGHQVSVTGVMSAMSAPEGTAPDKPAHTTGQPPTPDEPRGMAAHGPTLTVTGLSMIAATCTTGS